MPFLSQAGQVALKTQASAGTFANPNVAAPNQGVYIRTTSGAMTANRDLLVPDPEIGGNRDVPDAALGAVAFSGEFNAYVRHEFLATLVRAALGGASVDSGTALTGYTH